MIKFIRSFAVFVGLLTAASFAAAQSGPADDSTENLDEVTVTGSRIRGHANPSAQVYSITSKDIEQQGLTTADDLFRSIPQVSGRGSMAAMDVNEQVPSGSVGHSSIDLGGFGAKSTLVLINGRRTANSSIMYGASVNIGTIPPSALVSTASPSITFTSAGRSPATMPARPPRRMPCAR